MRVRRQLPPGQNTLANAAEPNTLRAPRDNGHPEIVGTSIAPSSNFAPGASPPPDHRVLAEETIALESARAIEAGADATGDPSSMAPPWADWVPVQRPEVRRPLGWWAGRMLGLAIVVIVVIFGRPNAEPSAGDAAWAALRVGDCFNTVDGSDTRQDAKPNGDVAAPPIAPVSCLGTHMYEVFGLASDPAPAGAAFPGDEAVADRANDACADLFQGYVGISFDASHLRVADRQAVRVDLGSGRSPRGLLPVRPEPGVDHPFSEAGVHAVYLPGIRLQRERAVGLDRRSRAR